MANVDYLVEGIQSLTDTDSLLRSICFAVYPLTRNRIHVDGLRATGAPIGQYNDSYLKIRTGKTYNLLSDPSIIFVLTGDMERNYKIIAISDTEYGLGFDIDTEAKKANWLADRFGNDIWQLSDSELDAMESIIQQYINDAFA